MEETEKPQTVEEAYREMKEIDWVKEQMKWVKTEYADLLERLKNSIV
jgi:hypothetical protein